MGQPAKRLRPQSWSRHGTNKILSQWSLWSHQKFGNSWWSVWWPVEANELRPVEDCSKPQPSKTKQLERCYWQISPGALNDRGRDIRHRARVMVRKRLGLKESAERPKRTYPRGIQRNDRKRSLKTSASRSVVPVACWLCYTLSTSSNHRSISAFEFS